MRTNGRSRFLVPAHAALVLACLQGSPAQADDVTDPFEYLVMSGPAGIQTWLANTSVSGTGSGDWTTTGYTPDGSWIRALALPTFQTTPTTES